MKKVKILFWTSTTLIFLFEGVMPALTFNSSMAIEGITHLGYPIYFVTLLTIFKVLGALALIIPQVPARIKEWAYVGFGFDFTFAFISILIVDGVNVGLILPVVALLILYVSYINFHKIEVWKRTV